MRDKSRSSHSRSRSRGRRGDSRKSPQERNYGAKRSTSRSGSRGRDSRRNDNFQSKRRSKFSDPSGPSQGMGGSSRGSGGFSSGFGDLVEDRGNRTGGFGPKPTSSFGSNEHSFHGDSNASGFSYPNMRGGDFDAHLDIDKAIQIQKQDSAFNRTLLDRAAIQSSGFQAPFPTKPAGGYETYTQNSSSLRQGGTKISRKVIIPQDGKFNYIGLIIGPKGSNQKELEEKTSCKILIRGRGSQKQGQPAQPDDNEDLHVLIEGDQESNVTMAMREIESILFMDEEEKEKKRDQQLRSAAGGGGNSQGRYDFHQTSDKVTYIQVPNNCVGLVIGRKGETIKQIKEQTGAERVYMQSEASRNKEDNFQNLIVEGSPDAVEKVRERIDEIKSQQQRKNNQGSEARIEMEVPANLAGLVIGKQGSTLQQIGQQTNTRCSIQQNINGTDDPRKILIILGSNQEDCNRAKEIFQDKMNARMNAINNTGGRFPGNVGSSMPNRGGMPPSNGGYQNSRAPPSSGGRPGFNSNRRPRRNADGDEIVEDANQYEQFYPGYQSDPMMQNQQMYANMYPQSQQFSQYPQSMDGYVNQDGTMVPSDKQQEVGPDGQIISGDGAGYPGYPSQYDPVQMQLYQQYYYQMYLQNQAPQIEEVFADGSVVSGNPNQGNQIFSIISSTSPN